MNDLSVYTLHDLKRKLYLLNIDEETVSILIDDVNNLLNIEHEESYEKGYSVAMKELAHSLGINGL